MTPLTCKDVTSGADYYLCTHRVEHHHRRLTQDRQVKHVTFTDPTTVAETDATCSLSPAMTIFSIFIQKSKPIPDY